MLKSRVTYKKNRGSDKECLSVFINLNYDSQKLEFLWYHVIIIISKFVNIRLTYIDKKTNLFIKVLKIFRINHKIMSF